MLYDLPYMWNLKISIHRNRANWLLSGPEVEEKGEGGQMVQTSGYKMDEF